MPLYLIEESAVKAAMKPAPDDPVWKLFEDGPIQRREGAKILGTNCIAFRVGPNSERHGQSIAPVVAIPAALVTEIDDQD